MNHRLTFFCHSILINTSKPSRKSIAINPRTNAFSLFRAFMNTSTRLNNNTNFRRVNVNTDPNDLSTLMKEDGVSVCSELWIESFRNPNQTVTNLTNYLRRFELWVLAYQKVCADEMGAYMPRSSVQRPALEDLLALRNVVLDNRFRWGARLEFFIKSPKDMTEYESLSKRKIRAILTTTQPSPFQDGIVQEVLFMILEPVYEARFFEKSYEFRPGRTAHTALRVIRRSLAGYLWYIKRDLSTILDGLKVGMVIGALMRDVRDKLVIDLIKSTITTPVITSPPVERKRIKRKYQKRGF